VPPKKLDCFGLRDGLELVLRERRALGWRLNVAEGLTYINQFTPGKTSRNS